ncbi:MAG: histone deacetylase [Pseudomonadota bacterium]
MKVFYSDTFDLNLPPGHRFPGQKYGMLRRRLIEDGVVREHELFESPLADDAVLLRAHSESYVRSIEDGSIDPKAMRRIGFPWGPHIARRARATSGGALAAARAALKDGLSGQLAGGTHHAHRDFGSGYCVFNDQAAAALTLLAEGLIDRAAFVDLDVHQGDGNSAIMTENPNIFVLSVHGEKNFPFRKVPSDLDIGLPDNTEDDAFLSAVFDALPSIWDFKPDIIFYQAGVDPLKEDRLGRLSLSHEGLMMRDRMVLAEAFNRGLPVAMAIGGGYADPIGASVEAYANTYRVARSIFG